MTSSLQKYRRLNSSKRMKIFSYILLAMVLATPALAQERRMTPEQRRERVETVIIGKFAEELELSPAEAEKFYPLLRQFRSETEPMQRELGETRHELDALSESDISSVKTEHMLKSLNAEKSAPLRDESSKSDIKALISKSNSLQTEILAKREVFLTNIADFLTPQQVSRCSILLDELPRRIRQFMEERGGPPPGEMMNRMQERQQRRHTR